MTRELSVDRNMNESNHRSDGNNAEQEKDEIEHNPRWMCYLCIVMFSVINFISISSIPWEYRGSVWASSMPFGVLTFLIASLILIQDRWGKKSGGFNFTKSKNGYIEGLTLLFCVFWWIIGVAYITRPGGIAYTISNIYYSAWFSLFACVYTLNEWSDSKDILTIAEITSVSFTLPYWWIHFLASFVVFVNSCSLEIQLSGTIDMSSIGEKRDTFFGIFVGLLSLIVSFYFILVHYDFVICVDEGGWAEILSGLSLIFVWIISTSIFTKNHGMAATTSGFDCIPRLVEDISDIVAVHNCTITKNGIIQSCRFGRYMPGSNLYFACWACMLSSVTIALKWKAAKALNFAQSKTEREQQQHAIDQVGGERYEDADVIDDFDKDVSG